MFLFFSSPLGCLGSLAVSVLVTLLYLGKRNLVVNIVAHAVIDGIALLLLPAIARAGA